MNNFNATAGSSFYHDSGTINANDFNVTAGGGFENYQPIYADNFNVTAGYDFENYSDVESNIISISARDFINVHTGGTEGYIYANTLTISVEGDFDYEDDYLDNGNIRFAVFNLNVGGDFSYDDSANDFGWGANDTLTVSGSASFNVDDFINHGEIDVANDFYVTAGDDFYNRDSATINADNFNVTLTYNYSDFSNSDNATINANDFNVTVTGTYGDFSNWNSATINANDFNVTAGNYFSNFGSTINANDFNVTAGTDFSNQWSATINADSFNVTAGGSFLNRDTARIIADSFNVTAGGSFLNRDTARIIADSFNVTAGTDFGNEVGGIINADNFNVTTGGNFYNDGFIVSGDARYFGNVFIENVNNLSIVPDGTTLTDAIQSSSGIDIINIARPDSNGLSNNSYSDFNVLSSGLVFNNSASAVSSSLAGTIAGNPNYTASDSASLILNQITSNNPSYLGGILEVAGDSAAIIIANPNGIFCDVCSFANTDKVDLITGTANFDTAGVIFASNDIFIYPHRRLLSMLHWYDAITLRIRRL